MRRLPLFQVDAFADRPFVGNPAAVCPLEAWLDDATMQAIALENNLSETAFFVPRPAGDGVDGECELDLRWFTPAAEVDLCGHATLASAHVVLTRLAPGAERVGFHTRSGRLEVERAGSGYAMDLPSQPPAPANPPPGLVDALGRPPSAVLKASWYWLAVYDTEQDVRAVSPDFRALAGLGVEVIVTAPADDAGLDFVSRMFAPAVGVDEDPVTGSAHCTLTPYWVERLGRNPLRARQVSSRGGELGCELRGERVRLTGDAVLVLEGELLLP